MGITAITIENFKGIREPVRVELKPITLLFGPNSAGKSTIIQALHYAREIFERQNLNPDRTLLGGDAIDLGGFESLVHKHDTNLPIKIGFELDLSNEDLPVYYDSEIEYIGIDRLDNAASAFLLGAPTRVSNAQVEVTIRWSEQFTKPYIALYTVRTNDKDLISVESSPDGLQVYISKINLLNPIFFRELEDEEIFELQEKEMEAMAKENELRLEEEDEEMFEVYPKSFEEEIDAMAEANALREEEELEMAISQEAEEMAIEEGKHLGFQSYIVLTAIGDTFKSLFQNINVENKVPGVKKPINLVGQHSALPNWGNNLSLDSSIWEENIEIEDKSDVIRLLSSLTVGPGELVRDGLRNLCYVGPLREVPNRTHQPATSPEESRWANGLAAYDTLFFSDDIFIDKVNEWLSQEERLHSGYSVEVKKYRELDADNPLTMSVLQGRVLDDEMNLRDSLLALPVKRRLLIRDEARNIELAPQDIGVGISQVLPVVVAALHHKTGLVVIEQPELHIHPAFQVALGDLFIEQIHEHSDLTFILETHSEHLILRILRRIRATHRGENKGVPVTNRDVGVIYVMPKKCGSIVTNIPITEDGDFETDWPGGFFDERETELFD